MQSTPLGGESSQGEDFQIEWISYIFQLRWLLGIEVRLYFKAFGRLSNPQFSSASAATLQLCALVPERATRSVRMEGGN